MEKDAQIMIKMLPLQVEHEKKLKQTNVEMEKNAKLMANTWLHKAVEFDYNDKEGRFTKASQKLNVAEEVLVENAICATLFEKFAKSHCQYCFARYGTLLNSVQLETPLCRRFLKIEKKK